MTAPVVTSVREVRGVGFAVHQPGRPLILFAEADAANGEARALHSAAAAMHAVTDRNAPAPVLKLWEPFNAP